MQMSSKRWKFIQRVLNILLITLVFASSTYVLFLLMSPLKASPLTVWPQLNLGILMAHAVTGLIPFFIGVFTFDADLRVRRLNMHRTLGKIYCFSIWISSVTGVAVASANQAGIASQLGFGLLGVLWFSTTTMAYVKAKDKKLVEHRVWMIRSYALTLAALTVRPLSIFAPESIDPHLYNNFISWACWIPNLILAELYIRVTTHAGGWRGLKKTRREARKAV